MAILLIDNGSNLLIQRSPTERVYLAKNRHVPYVKPIGGGDAQVLVYSDTSKVFVEAFKLSEVASPTLTMANVATDLPPYFFECCSAASSCCADWSLTSSQLFTMVPTGGGGGTTRTMAFSALITPNNCCAGIATADISHFYTGIDNNSVTYTSLVKSAPIGWAFIPTVLPQLFGATLTGPAALATPAAHCVIIFTMCGVSRAYIFSYT
jgi:hypothetical protein